MKVIILLLTLTAAALAQPSAPIKDSRDGKTYRTVKIGEQVWMAENLGYEVEGSKCYENKPENCEKYGRLYNWKTAKKVCPKGWHLPKNEEWDRLYKFVDSSYIVKNEHSKVAGKYLKAKDGWKEDGNGIDKYGFAALPSGCGVSDGFLYVGIIGFWWSTSEGDASNAYGRYMSYDYENAYSSYSKKTYLQSVRCVRD